MILFCCISLLNLAVNTEKIEIAGNETTTLKKNEGCTDTRTWIDTVLRHSYSEYSSDTNTRYHFT